MVGKYKLVLHFSTIIEAVVYRLHMMVYSLFTNNILSFRAYTLNESLL